MSTAHTFDPIWEERYRAGHRQKYPWDMVVSFVFRNAPQDRPRSNVTLLELGFGAGSNLFFAAAEGFAVSGVEGSESAVTEARSRFSESGLTGDLQVGDFTKPLPFENSAFDLVIDRGAITCCSMSDAKRVISEVARVLRPGGTFLFTPYGREHAGFDLGTKLGDGLVTDIRGGHLKDHGQVCFYSKDDVFAAFDSSWRMASLEHAIFEDMLGDNETRAEWRVVAVRDL